MGGGEGLHALKVAKVPEFDDAETVRRQQLVRALDRLAAHLRTDVCASRVSFLIRVSPCAKIWNAYHLTRVQNVLEHASYVGVFWQKTLGRALERERESLVHSVSPTLAKHLA